MIAFIVPPQRSKSVSEIIGAAPNATRCKMRGFPSDIRQIRRVVTLRGPVAVVGIFAGSSY